MNNLAMQVGDDLHFNMSRVFDIFFEVNSGVVKRLFCFESRRFQSSLQRNIASSSLLIKPSLPGTRLTLACFAISLAVTLSPSLPIASTEGPMNSILHSRQTS